MDYEEAKLKLEQIIDRHIDNIRARQEQDQGNISPADVQAVMNYSRLLRFNSNGEREQPFKNISDEELARLINQEAEEDRQKLKDIK